MLFLCVHNAGRSQMALGWFNHLAGDRAVAWSGGSEPGAEVNPAAVAAMAEVGIDISQEFPKPWTEEIVQAADVVVTMGCGDACPLFPGKRYEDWTLDDPFGKTVDDGPAGPRRDRAPGPGAARQPRGGADPGVVTVPGHAISPAVRRAFTAPLAEGRQPSLTCGPRPRAEEPCP